MRNTPTHTMINWLRTTYRPEAFKTLYTEHGTGKIGRESDAAVATVLTTATAAIGAPEITAHMVGKYRLEVGLKAKVRRLDAPKDAGLADLFSAPPGDASEASRDALLLARTILVAAEALACAIRDAADRKEDAQ